MDDRHSRTEHLSPPSFRRYTQTQDDHDAAGPNQNEFPETSLWAVYDKIRGCLLGGAIGDALGAPLENLTYQQIRKKFGSMTGFVEHDAHWGRVTGNTQLTCYTAEGVIRSFQRYKNRGICSVQNVLEYTYHRWLEAQNAIGPIAVSTGHGQTGWLMNVPELRFTRGKSLTLRHALLGKPQNSKGNGALTRIAPVGLAPFVSSFESGCEIASISHGHPLASLSAGIFAEMIARALRGDDFLTAARQALELIESKPEALPLVRSIQSALKLGQSGATKPEDYQPLGPGVDAVQALCRALSVTCLVTCHPDRIDAEQGLLLAVSAGGATDAVGSLTGQLLGAFLGHPKLPQKLCTEVELAALLETIARDMFIGFFRGFGILYPPN